MFTIVITSPSAHTPRVFTANRIEAARSIANPILDETNYIFMAEQGTCPIETHKGPNA